MEKSQRQLEKEKKLAAITKIKANLGNPVQPEPLVDEEEEGE